MTTASFSESTDHEFLNQLPANIWESFTPEQRQALQSVNHQKWNEHPLDIRRSIKFWRWEYYFVVLGGREKRKLTRKQERRFQLAELYFYASYVGFAILLGLIALYLIKSALGIDLFENHHLGLWTWVEVNVLGRG